MNWLAWAGLALAVLGLLGSIIGTAVFVTWRLSGVAVELRDLISVVREETDQKIAAARQATVDTADTVRREFGETVNAMQNKIHEFEKWSRDTFVKRDSFLVVTNEVKETIREQGKVSKEGLEQIGRKLDGLIEKFINVPKG